MTDEAQDEVEEVQAPHPHDDHHHDHHCPDHYHRCHATFHGYIDCPTPHFPHPHIEPKRMTKMVTVPCGAQDPTPQIAAFLNNPGNHHPLVTSVLDLGHDGWLVIFSVDP